MADRKTAYEVVMYNAITALYSEYRIQQFLKLHSEVVLGEVFVVIRRTQTRVGNNSSSGVLLSASITPFPCRNSITSFLLIILSLPITLVEIARCTSMSLDVRRPIEVVEHKIHVCLLLPLQVVLYSFVSMNFNFDVSICLSGNCSWFVEHRIFRVVIG